MVPRHMKQHFNQDYFHTRKVFYVVCLRSIPRAAPAGKGILLNVPSDPSPPPAAPVISPVPALLSTAAFSLAGERVTGERTGDRTGLFVGDLACVLGPDDSLD